VSYPFRSASSIPDVSPSTLAWSLYGDGHVIAASIVRSDPRVEARIVLDGHVIYRRLHESLADAAEELVAIRGHWSQEGWLDTELSR